MRKNLCNRIFLAFLAMWPLWMMQAHAAPREILACVMASGPLQEFPFPVYAWLSDGSGHDCLITKATESDLQVSGLEYRALAAVDSGGAFYLAMSRRPEARARLRASANILCEHGRTALLQISDPDELDRLGRLGFEVCRLPDQPMVLAPRTAVSRLGPLASVTSNALVSEMMAQVSRTNLHLMLNDYTGVSPAVAGGSYSNIRTRHTNSGLPVRRAAAFAYDRLQALGLNVSYHSWSASGFSGLNVVGVRPGTTASSEIVVVCAHYDDMPSGALAPGADDNASGVLAVLEAAARMRRYSFERTIRYVLFSGEEQGLYGSAAYAAAAAAAGDNLVGVINLDMISWDNNNDGQLRLHTRSTSNPGYAGDHGLVETFTNVVRTYGLSGVLEPIVTPDGDTYSDHSSFWDRGYPAILAIEEDYDDFCAYYHTVNDQVVWLNMPYYTRYSQALIGTVAHLARPVGRVSFDAVEVANGTFVTNTTVGVGRWVAVHTEGALEGADAMDVAWSAMPTNPNPAWLAIGSVPYATNLLLDARPPGSETTFRGRLIVTNLVAGGLTCTNRLRFVLPAGFESNGLYFARIAVTGAYTAGGVDFVAITNLREVVAAGGYVNLPSLANVTNGTVYGSCEISRRWMQAGDADAELHLALAGEAAPAPSVYCQLGAVVVDRLDYTTSLATNPEWTLAGIYTNAIPANDMAFESGGATITLANGAPAWSNQAAIIRHQRQWLKP